MKKTLNKVAIYRCIFSSYDIILPELIVYENIDYYLFTDNENLNIYPYKTVVVGSKYETPSFDNRFIKLILPDILATYDTTIYIDSNIAIVGNIRNLLDEFISSESDIGLFAHPYDNSLNEEVDLCLLKGKCSKTKVSKELEYYSSLSISSRSRLSDNSIIFRKKHNLNMSNAMSFWFNTVHDFSGRDQISLPYVRSRYNLKEYFFDFSPRTKKNNYFIVFPHKVGRGNSSKTGIIMFYLMFSAKLVFRKYVFFKNKFYGNSSV